MTKLTVNKTKLVKLCREMGYNPPKDAEFTKAFRVRWWWLEWGEDGIYYKASLFSDAGRVFLGVRKESKERQYGWYCLNVTNDQLARIGLLEEHTK